MKLILKENGNVVVSEITKEQLKEISNNGNFRNRNASTYVVHKCFDNCANACANKCSKVATVRKKDISEYEYITDGYQVVNDDNTLEKFVVSKCNNYEYESPKVFTSEDKKRLSEARKKLRMAYFGTDTVEDSYIVQYELEKRGDLVGARGKHLSKDRILELQLIKSKKIR